MTWHALLQHGSIRLKPQGDLLEKIFVGAKSELFLKRKVTSLEEILARPVTAEEVQEAIISGFEQK